MRAARGLKNRHDIIFIPSIFDDGATIVVPPVLRAFKGVAGIRLVPVWIQETLSAQGNARTAAGDFPSRWNGLT